MPTSTPGDRRNSPLQGPATIGAISNMKTEIETRFLEVDKAGLISKLNTLHATDKCEVRLNEVIFYDADREWQKENKFVRLRKKNDTVQLTFKSNKGQAVDSAKEVEFSVPSFDDAKAFLEAVGLVAYRTVEKYRHTFELDRVIIDIDTWPKIPPYAELEGESVGDLQAVAEKLGLVWNDRFDGDARYVYKHYGFDFDTIRTVTFDRFE